MLPPSAAICLLGFGDTGRCFGAELAARGGALRGYDPLLEHPATRPGMQQRIEDAGVHAAATLAEALRGTKLVIFTVPVGAARQVAVSAASMLQPGQIFLDLCAASAAMKHEHAALIQAAGADYVEATLLAGAENLRLSMPMRLVGSRAGALAPALNALGFDACAADSKLEPESVAVAVTSPLAEGLVLQQARRGELP